MDAFAQKGFETIGALRTNRIIYPNQTRQQAKQFAPSICKDDPNVSLVTVGRRSYYVYRYQGKMNDHEDVVVLLSYPEKSFGDAKALRVFISTRTELATQEILSIYANRWSIEVFFRSSLLTSASFARRKGLRECGSFSRLYTFYAALLLVTLGHLTKGTIISEIVFCRQFLLKVPFRWN